MEYMSLSRYIKLLFKKWKIILYSVLAFMVLAIIYSVFVYSPSYRSTSKILLKQDNANTYVVQLNSNNDIYSSLGQNINPILTQIEILKSYDLSVKVAKNLVNTARFSEYSYEQLARAVCRNIELENPPGTDIIEIHLEWDNPEDAQKISQAVLDSYYSYNDSIYKKSVSSTKIYIENQLKKTNKELLSVREEIEKYRKSKLSINVDLEAKSVIEQIERIENMLADANINISATDKKVSELSENLGLDLKNAIESVALGQSASLVKLNQDLNTNQQQLASLKIKYTDNTPQIKVLESLVKEIKSQIGNETISIIGKKLSNKNNSIISDNVRLEMVDEYVKSSVDLKSYKSQRATLENYLENLKNNQKIIPEIQKTLSILQEKEATLSSIVETLNAKLVEAQIKESAIVSNIDVVQAPLLPKNQSFPTIVHVLFIFMFTGVLVGVIIILGMYYIEDICEGTEELEEILKAPVLGTIPWLTNASYGNLLSEYNPHSIAAIIYQKIAISLKVKCYNKKYNSIAIISSDMEKRRSIITASLANTLAKTEERVFLVDTDFRNSSLTREFNIDFSKFPDITDCILELSKANSKVYIDEKAYYDEIVGKYIIHIPGYENLFLIPNNNKVDNPYEILNNDAFPKLMQILKASFDLVILDTPPMLAVADSIITSQHVDGLIVLSGVKACRSNLRKIRKICDENYVEILGAIARDTLTELEVPENMYIKQLSGKIE